MQFCVPEQCHWLGPLKRVHFFPFGSSYFRLYSLRWVLEKTTEWLLEMPDYTFDTYLWSPYDEIPTSLGTFVFNGDTSNIGTAVITDNETGFDGLTLDDNVAGSQETATATVTTPTQTFTDIDVNADAGWTLYDPIADVTFEVVLFNGKTGSVSFLYTLSEYPLVEGRTYEVIAFDNQPNAQVPGEPYFTYGDYVCYAPGTLIDTPDGPRAVETLQPGVLILTRDNGPQPVRWTRRSDHPLESAEPEVRPVLIKAGALGKGLPAENLIVSPKHRIFVGGGGQLEGIFSAEMFVAAKSLTDLPGIRYMMGKKQITWVHFACDRHEIVCANGCWTESLLLGPMVLQVLRWDQRKALRDMFRLNAATVDTSAALNGPPARPCLAVGKTRQLIAEYLEKSRIAA